MNDMTGHATVTTTRGNRRGEASKRTAVEKLYFPLPGDMAGRQ